MRPALAAIAAALLLPACAGAVDRYTLRQVIPRAASDADVGRACALGDALGSALASAGRGQREPDLAMIIAHTTAGFCAEGLAWEAELEAARWRFRLQQGDDASLPQLRDARLGEERAHAAAAHRFLQSWQHMQLLYGPTGEDCPRLRQGEGVIYLLGLYAGVNALLHDRASGGGLGVPMDIPVAVARATGCVDDATWWHGPAAMQAAAEAMVPGLAPQGSDPWHSLELAALASEPTGVRLGRGLQVLVAANAGRQDEVLHGIQAHAAALQTHPQLAAWGLLDEYARLVTLHESDLVWTAATGHRTPSLGELPSLGLAPAGQPDPFAGDDPFGAPEPAPSEPPTAPEATP